MSSYGSGPSKASIISSIVGVIAVIVVIAFFLGSPLKKTPADQIGLSYGGGIFEGAQYQKTVGPGSGLVFNGFFDKFYEYPTTQRNYIISMNAAEGDRGHADAIKAFTSDKVQTEVELAVTFKLNANIARKFHENIGLKYKAWDDDGWDKMLNDNFRQPLENSVQQVIRGYDVNRIASDATVLQDVQDAVESSLKHEVNTLLGGEYFCGPAFKYGVDECPDFRVAVKRIALPNDVVKAFESQQVEAAKVVSATSQAQQKAERAKGEKLAADAAAASLTPEYRDYLYIQALAKCADNPKCTIVATQGDTGVNVNTGG